MLSYFMDERTFLFLSRKNGLWDNLVLALEVNIYQFLYRVKQ